MALRKQLDNSKLKNDTTESHLGLLKNKLAKLKSQEKARASNRREVACQKHPEKELRKFREQSIQVSIQASISASASDKHSLLQRQTQGNYEGLVSALRDQYVN